MDTDEQKELFFKYAVIADNFLKGYGIELGEGNAYGGHLAMLLAKTHTEADREARIDELKRWKKAAFQDDYNFSMYDIDRIKELTKEDSKS